VNIPRRRDHPKKPQHKRCHNSRFKLPNGNTYFRRSIEGMSKGLGHIERAIADRIERAKASGTRPRTPVCVRTSDVLFVYHRPPYPEGKWIWRPEEATPAQRKAAVRALHSFARKHPQYALTGGKGRKELILYEPADPLGEAHRRAARPRLAKTGTGGSPAVGDDVATPQAGESECPWLAHPVRRWLADALRRAQAVQR
jgi:hypothetical protein